MHGGAPALTVASENIHANNAEAGTIAQDLLSRAPDVIALQELDPSSLAAVLEMLGSHYPHSDVVGTVCVWSVYALSGQERLDLGLGWVSCAPRRSGGPRRANASLCRASRFCASRTV